MIHDFIGVVSDRPQTIIQFDIAFQLHALNENAMMCDVFPSHTRHSPWIKWTIDEFAKWEPKTNVSKKDFKGEWHRVYKLLLFELKYTQKYMDNSKKMNLKEMEHYEELMRTAHNYIKLMLFD